MIIFKYFMNIEKQYGLKNILLATIITTLILVAIDYYNLSIYIFAIWKNPILFCALLFLIVQIISFRFLDLFFLKSVNYIDFYGIASLMGIILYKIMLFFYADILLNSMNKTILTNSILCIIVPLEVIRYIYLIYIECNNRNKTSKNIFDLKQLYDDEIPAELEFFLIGDEAVSYDLLERNKIIDQIANTIRNCNNDSKYVISLKGAWGSGKTTILNNVKNKFINENIICIDDFEPWVYNDEKSLLIAFFDTIMKNINCGFRINEINEFTKIYVKTITANIGYSIGNLFKNNIDIHRIKEIINNYLNLNDKKIVLILDNLERCSSEHILFLLKMIHSVFDFERIIYVLSYDEIAMKKHFDCKLDIDYSYLEKIVQLEFTVPKLDENVLQIVLSKCLKNYIKHSKQFISENEQKEIIQIIIGNIKDLRDLKRIINSTFNASFNNSQYLNSIDMLMIEIISLKNPELWNEINTNSIFYISEDRYVYENKYIYDTNKYNTDTTQYFNELFDNNKLNINNYNKMLCYLFPNVKKYFDENQYRKNAKIEFIPEYPIYNDKARYRASVIGKRIYNSKFFNLYFNKNENEFIKIDERIRNFIIFLNENNDCEPLEMYDQYFLMEKVYSGWMEKYTLETFEMYLDRINIDKYLPLVLVMYYSFNLVDDSPLFFQTNAKKRTTIVIAELILKLPDDDFQKFIGEIKEDYRNLFLIKEILYGLNYKNKSERLANKSKYDFLNELYKDMLIHIKQKRINMYNPEYYNMHNMVLLFDDEEYMRLIINKIDKNNLMLFILDCIGTSTGTNGIGYRFNIENIERFYGWNKAKEDIKYCPDSDLKKFLIKAIETANYEEENGRVCTYYVNEWIDLDKLVRKYLKQIDTK